MSEVAEVGGTSVSSAMAALGSASESASSAVDHYRRHGQV